MRTASPSLISAVATIVFIGTLGLLLVVAGFGIIRVCEEMMEALGFLPARWGENNLKILVQLAAVVSAPIVVWFSVWFFRKSRAAEVKMQEYEAAHPKSAA